MADGQQEHQPTVSIAPRQAVNQPVLICWCVPDYASSAVKNTRRVSIALIIVHAVAMFSTWRFRFIGNAIGIVMGSILLCSFKKCTYTTAGFMYILGFALDAINAGILITIFTTNDSSDELFSDDVTPIGETLLFTITPLIGAFLFLFGSVSAFEASRNWERSGALGASPV